MQKYTLGVMITAAAVGTAAGYNINIVTGVASSFVVFGISYMISGMIESVLKAVFAHDKAMNDR